MHYKKFLARWQPLKIQTCCPIKHLHTFCGSIWKWCAWCPSS